MTSSPSMSGSPRSRMTMSGWRVAVSTTRPRPWPPRRGESRSPTSAARRKRRICGSSSMRTHGLALGPRRRRRWLGMPVLVGLISHRRPHVRRGAGNGKGETERRPLLPGRFSAQIRPPCASTNPRQMARPRPTPAPRSLGPGRISRRRAPSSSGSRPGPCRPLPPSIAPSSTQARRLSMGVPLGVYFAGVVQEVDEHLLDEDVVHGDHREVLGNPGETWRSR